MWADRYLAWDTETTGLGTSARIIELGCVLYEQGAAVSEWSTRLNPPGVDWSDPRVLEALSVNGLTPEDLEGSPTFEEAYDDIRQVMRQSDVWVAHNSDFDARMLRQELGHLGDYALSNLPRWMLCTRYLATEFVRLRNYKLETVAQHWAVTQPSAHRAVVDARTCGDVLLAMFWDAYLPIDDEEMGKLYRHVSSKYRR